MKLLKHYGVSVRLRKVWLSAQLMGRIEGSQTAVTVGILVGKIMDLFQ